MNDSYSSSEFRPDRERSSADAVESRESIPVMIRGLASDLSTLFSKEILLAKAEVREAASHLKAAISTMAMGAVLAMAGVVVLLLAAVAGLNNVLDLWLSALIVGLAALLVGFIMIKSASKKIEPAALIPERAIESVQRDKKTAGRIIR